MNEIFTQFFGDNAAAAQYAVTAVAVVILLLIVVWLIRRFSRLRIGGLARGRVPRLAIVDAMAIDARRRLILIRRDTVEHLILIGGPSDVVVEPSILRTRQRPPQPTVGREGQPVPPPVPAAVVPAAQPGAMSAPGASTPIRTADAAAADRAPIPFPFSRIPPPPSAGGLGNGRAPTNGAANGSDYAPLGGRSNGGSGLPILDAAPDDDGAGSDGDNTRGDELPNLFPGQRNGSGRAHANGGVPASLLAPAPSDSAAHKVSQLEAEMNRLFGQIAADRRSP